MSSTCSCRISNVVTTKRIYNYADHLLLQEDIDRVDQIYLWFVGLKEEGRKKLA
ncbi:MAG TPA: hypothetical protein VFU50_03560 [Terriglobales bacterium]|nr:hypothetical protein [Terriglobales bacterium]